MEITFPTISICKTNAGSKRKSIENKWKKNVTVPADVSSTVNLLPRLENETGTIKVQLKRKLQYKSFALSLNVRPHKVVQAADWLITNSDLYKEEGIIVNRDWQSNFVENISGTQDEPDNKPLITDPSLSCPSCQRYARESL